MFALQFLSKFFASKHGLTVKFIYFLLLPIVYMFVYSDFYSIGKESYRRNISVLQLRLENGKNLLCGVGISLPKFQSQKLICTKYAHIERKATIISDYSKC
jgi:hypothetical protein